MSLPSDRLRVGECMVDIPLREIHAPGARRPRRVTPKSIGVLLALVEQAGRVVSRDALLAQVWPDTLPTNDVVTQAITQLRKAFDDERGNPRYIETIAKNGYRLLAPVEWLERAEPTSVAGSRGHESGPVPASARCDGSLRPAPVEFAAAGARSPRRWASPALLVVAGAWPGRCGATSPIRRSGAAAHRRAHRRRRGPRYRLITSLPGFESARACRPMRRWSPTWRCPRASGARRSWSRPPTPARRGS